VQEELGQVAEGVFNAKSVRGLAAELGVEMPITEAVYRLLYGDLSPEELFTEVLGRDLKREF
jgi:glycerol-3-phosphate dehydrogenase (NAD(P)+)